MQTSWSHWAVTVKSKGKPFPIKYEVNLKHLRSYGEFSKLKTRQFLVLLK